MELQSLNLSYAYNGINVNVGFYNNQFNVSATKSRGARAETLTVSYDREGVRYPAEVALDAPYDADFFAALEAKIALLNNAVE